MQEINYTKRNVDRVFSNLFTLLQYKKMDSSQFYNSVLPGGNWSNTEVRLFIEEYSDGDIVFSVANVRESFQFYYFPPVSLFDNKEHINDFIQQNYDKYRIRLSMRYMGEIDMDANCFYDSFIADKEYFDNVLMKKSRVKRALKKLSDVVRVETTNEVRLDEFRELYKKWAKLNVHDFDISKVKEEILGIYEDRAYIHYFYYGDTLIGALPGFLPKHSEKANVRVISDCNKTLFGKNLDFITDEKHRKDINTYFNVFMHTVTMRDFFEKYPNYIWDFEEATDEFERETYFGTKGEIYKRVGYEIYDLFNGEVLNDTVAFDKSTSAFDYSYFEDGDIVKAEKILLNGDEDFLGGYYKDLSNAGICLNPYIFPGNERLGTHIHNMQHAYKWSLFLYRLTYADGDTVSAIGTFTQFYHTPYSLKGNKEHINELFRLFKIHKVYKLDDTLDEHSCYLNYFQADYDTYSRLVLQDKFTRDAIDNLTNKVKVAVYRKGLSTVNDYISEANNLYDLWATKVYRKGSKQTSLNYVKFSNIELDCWFIYIYFNNSLVALQPIYQRGHFYNLTGGISFTTELPEKMLDVYKNYIVQSAIFKNDKEATIVSCSNNCDNAFGNYNYFTMVKYFDQHYIKVEKV